MKKAKQYFEDEYGKLHIEMVVGMGDTSSIFDLMNEYAIYLAKQVATKALKDAADNARMRVDSIFGHEVMNVDSFCDPDGDTISIDKESITNTKIEIP